MKNMKESTGKGYLYTTMLGIIIAVMILTACIKKGIQEPAPDLTHQMESEHFICYFNEPDKNIAQHFMAKLEEGYKKISGILQYQLDKKVAVEIYPNLQDFRKAVGIPNTPDWMIATVSSRNQRRTTIKIVSPHNPGPHHSSDFIKNRVVIHELAQIMIYGKAGHRPAIWLYKGLASYWGENLTKEEIKHIISEEIKQNKVPEFNDLQPLDGEKVPEGAFNNVHGYEYSYTIVDFIMTRFGFDHILALLAEPEYPFDYERIFQLAEEELYTQWVQYLQTNYVL